MGFPREPRDDSKLRKDPQENRKQRGGDPRGEVAVGGMEFITPRVGAGSWRYGFASSPSGVAPSLGTTRRS